MSDMLTEWRRTPVVEEEVEELPAGVLVEAACQVAVEPPRTLSWHRCCGHGYGIRG